MPDAPFSVLVRVSVEPSPFDQPLISPITSPSFFASVWPPTNALARSLPAVPPFSFMMVMVASSPLEKPSSAPTSPPLLLVIFAVLLSPSAQPIISSVMMPLFSPMIVPPRMAFRPTLPFTSASSAILTVTVVFSTAPMYVPELTHTSPSTVTPSPSVRAYVLSLIPLSIISVIFALGKFAAFFIR